MPDREADKETLRIDRSDDVTAPAAPPVKVDSRAADDDATAPAARPVVVRRAPAWRPTVARILTVLSAAAALFLLPQAVHQVRSLLASPPETRAAVEPVEDVELPPDPPLSAEVQELMKRGRAAEDAMQLAEARKLYARATKIERMCSSCQLRLAVVERRIEAFGFEALEAGNRYLADKRYEEAAKSFQKVLDLVPHKEARFHILAQAGLDEAREGAKRAGRPLP